ncbi:MAG: helix-turn-helix domain-containing protein [Gemmatimonadetes bacterium]|nr:helix-turn-helix domain-containing protein [Acidimicrobiia bacterium]MBA3584377.1 helix-turn-helix domain-containing protein [Gemmatimonadota bacterium]
MSIETFISEFDLKRTMVYELIASGELPSVKVRGRRLISRSVANEWLRSMDPSGPAYSRLHQTQQAS